MSTYQLFIFFSISIMTTVNDFTVHKKNMILPDKNYTQYCYSLPNYLNCCLSEYDYKIILALTTLKKPSMLNYPYHRLRESRN